MWRLCVLGLLPFASFLGAQDATEIVRRSIDQDRANWERARNYRFTQRVEKRELNDENKVENKETSTFETFVLYGAPYSKKVAENDRPLSEREARKEEEKLSKAAAERQRGSGGGFERLTEFEKDREKRRQLLLEIPEAFQCKLLGQETIEGRGVYVIGLEPRPGYKPKEARARMLFPNLRGKLWIDKVEYQWVRAEAEAINPITLGWVVARLAPGSKLVARQTRVNQEIWLPQHVYALLRARVVLVKQFHTELEVNFKDYQKYQSDSRVVGMQTPAHQ